ncbi:MAG: hydrogenase maturation nickel metallochaperone HypA [Spartobacteria bacterium]|nr:hydrogenase maturation nickel metallochaperone HypA [Spartobacteria bacterium]
MHELSLAQAMVQEIEAALAKEHATALLSINIKIGALSGVEKEAFAFAFPIVAEGTLLAGADLLFEEVPAAVTCRDCGKVSSPDVHFLQCAHCASINVDIVGGREFMIQSLEIET